MRTTILIQTPAAVRGCHEGHCVFVVPAVDGVTRLVSHINLPTPSGVTHTAVVLRPALFTGPAHRRCTLPIVCSPLRLHL